MTTNNGPARALTDAELDDVRGGGLRDQVWREESNTKLEALASSGIDRFAMFGHVELEPVDEPRSRQRLDPPLPDLNSLTR